MIQIKSVLVPIDFSKASEEAMRYGVSLASQFQARLVVAHIVPSFEAFNYAFPEDTQDFSTQAVIEARRQLPEQIPAVYREKLNYLSIVKCGHVRDELIGIVNDERIDFVVMGTHGRRNLERFFLGSTTESMLRKVPIPILTVSRPDTGSDRVAPAPTLRSFVYATDLSDGYDAGLHYITQLARSFSAELTLLHVKCLRDGGLFDSEADVRRDLLRKLWEGVERERCADIPIKTAVVDGVPFRAIVKFAEQVNADVLALNLHNKGVLERAMLGSTAERVIRSSRIPVLSVPVMSAEQFVMNRGVP